MLVSHCPEIHTRWTQEYENYYFARNWSRYKWKTILQPKKLRFLQKVTRYTNEGLAMAPDTITKSHFSWYFPQEAYRQGTRRSRDGYTVSKCEYDVCEPGREGVTFVFVVGNRCWYIKFGIYYILLVERTQIKDICYFKDVLFNTLIYNASYENKQKVLPAIVKIYFTVIIVLALHSLQNHLVFPWNRTSLWCKVVTDISSNFSTFLAPNNPCPLMVNIQKYLVISQCPWNEVLVLVL